MATDDGSQTVYSEQFKEQYHSMHGAVTESRHVFINAGLLTCRQRDLRIFEVGFGTGLNAYLTFAEATKLMKKISYHALELFPLDMAIIEQLKYPEFLASDIAVFKTMHEIPWNWSAEIVPGFYLHKIKANLLEYEFKDNFDLVYFDAFSPEQQPGLWSIDVLRKIYACMSEGGILVTYCAKGAVRRAMRDVGFITERLPGPPGKREMLRATKL